MASVDGWAPAKDISGWAASATTHSDNESDSDDEEGQMATGGPSTDWSKVADVLRRGRVKERREELTSIEKLAKNGEIPATHLAPVVGLLLSLTTRYSDLPSTVSLVNALSSLSSTSTDDSSLVLGKWAKWAKAESTQRSPDRTTAASSQYHLLLHLAAIVQVWGSSTTKEEQWQTLIPMLAAALDSVLDEEYGAKTAVRQAAVKRVRKLFRMNSSFIAPVFQVLTSTASDALAPRRSMPLLGLVVDVCLHLRAGKETEKGAVGGIGRGYIEASKAAIIETWRAAVADPSPAPSHVRNALRDFFASCLTPEEVEAVVASVEKNAVRAPTSSFQALESLISPLTMPLPAKSETAMVALVFASTKSAKSEVRAAAVHFFDVLVPRMTDVTTREKAGDEIVTVLKSGKFVSADHRAALYALLRVLPPSSAFSSKVAAVLPGLIPKENTAEAALAALLDALSPHLAASLSAGVAIPAPVLAAFTKELATPKAVNRRLVVGCAGETLWLLSEMEKEGAWNAEAAKFGDAVAKALADGSLKTVAAGPLTVTGGVGEGFVAVATLLGPLSKSGSKPSSVIIAGNPILQAIATTSPKPSFILWDKVQRKAASASDEVWLLRALRALIERNEDKLSKDESLRIHAGISFINLAFSSAHSASRREALAVLRSLIQRRPKVFGRVLRDSLKAFLIQRESATVPLRAAVEEDTSKSPEAVAASVRQVLFTAVSFDEGTADEVKEDAVTELLVLAHHPVLGAAADRTFVDLALSARVNIAALVERNATKLTKLLWDAAGAPPKSSEFASAAFAAAKSLAFISPQIFVPEILAKVTHDLDPQHLDFIGTQELGIWATPDGTAFVDVLALKKTAPTPAGNRATAAMDKWEQEVRESAAAKKKAAGGAPIISKADQALINAQLATESETRAKIARVRSEMLRGLALIRSLVYANIDLFKAQLTDAIQAILNGPLEKGAFLVGEEAFRTFLLLGECCSSRLGLMRPFVGVAILRNYGVKSIPEEMQAESLSGLVIRVLYRLRALSEQAPFDAATYAYVTPLLTTVIAKGGAHSGLEGEEDTTTEQLALALEVMNFHCGEFSDTAFPRLSTISDILQLIGTQPILRKDAASALIDLGEAIKDNASNAEIDALIKGTLSPEVVVRNATLQALQPLDLTELDYSNELWIACHDDDAQNARLARHLWEDNGLDVPDTFPPLLLPFLEYDNSYVRSACAHAFAEGVAAHPETLEDVIIALEELYVERAKILAPEFDEFGMIREESLDRSDPFHIRLAVGHTFTSLAPYYTPETLVPFFEFLVKSEALGDRSGAVRRAMLDAGAAVIDAHGQVKLGELIQVFETNLSSKSSTEAGDHISEALVILFGRLASFLDKSDPRISKVVDRLVEALKTPSEAVQAAVSDCIPALVKRMQPEVPGLVARLYDLLIHGKKYAERRGAAYGLAGVVKGRGLSAIKEFDLINKLREAAKDKESFMSRQGALLAFETLSATLGRVFEPYVLAILPLLLSSFGDDTADVREATQDASRVMMSRLSGHCVNIVLPSLLEGLEEKQWRTKKGSIELLGAMAFCAPRQLAQSLPTIIPELTAVLTDSHAQVRKAANASLKKFGEVIHNPEIKALVPTLLKALVDPTSKTNAALGALLNTSFAHFIDSPSLALVAPIIERGLRERSATSKRKAVQILGNLSSLTDPKDFTPYLITFLPLVHVVLVDPVPEARATAAKALGTLVERLGEVNFPDLVQQLLQTLRSDTSGVDRQGAAQGLSEVLSGLGMDRLEALLPEIITNASSPRPYVREGFISLLVYLPATFGHRFAPHLGRIIPPILSGLADESEFVREASMRAGKMIISNYSTKAVDLLLPELEKGMVDENWRIRQSSIQLIGELLFRITGISGKAEIEEEEGAETGGVDSTRKVLLDVLGQEKRDRVLSTLYVVRQDAVNAVRTGSIHIWKALVQNTPRTLREILPSVINMVISLLSSPGHEQKETASRTLAELCRKNGDRILQDMVPILRQSVTSSNPALREGGCLAFAELLDSAADHQLEEHQNAIIAAIRTALIDENADVRAAAARVFDQMSQGEFGTKAIDQTVPTLLEALRTPGESSETALRAIKEVMSVRANTIFPVVIPTLITHPISAFNARALGSLISVAGGALSRRLAQLLTPIAKALETEKDEEILAEIRDTMRTLMQSVEDQEGIHSLMMILLGWARGETPARRVTGLQCFRTFCEVTEEDFADYRVDWVRQLISAFADRELSVVEAAWEALEALVKSVPKDELEDLVVPLRSSIEATAAPGNEVAGFSRPKGVQSIVPILLAGVLGGTHEQREQAAGGIGDLVLRTSEPGIKPYIVQLTGPLIRVISSQTFPPAVKNAILGTLTILLQRVPHLVRPFQPQLQRTFVKSVSDPASISIRNHAAEGLGVLMVSQTRVDPLITELVAGARLPEPEIASSMVHALACVATSAGSNFGAASKTAVEELVLETFENSGTDAYIEAMSRVIGGLALHDVEAVRPVFDRVLSGKPSALTSLTILSTLNAAPATFESLGMKVQVVKKVLASCAVVDNPSVGRPAREAREAFRAMGDEAVLALLEG